jgi:hypothetical protein
MPPRIGIVVRGGVVQEVASDTPEVLVKLLDLDSIEEEDPPDEWRAPDVVINDRALLSLPHTPRQNFLYLCGEGNRCGGIPFPSTAGPQRQPRIDSGAHRRVSDQPTRGLTPLLHGLLMPPCFSTVQL